MALGDGIRRNIRTVTPAEKDRFGRALLALLGKHAAGVGPDLPPASLSSWFDQDELLQASGRRHGAEFLPWLREQCNRFERLLRDVDPQLSLHYWDWHDDPRGLFGELPATGDGLAWLAPTDSEIVGADTFARMRALLEQKRVNAQERYACGTASRAHLSFRDPFVFPLHANVDRLFAMWQAQDGQAWRLDPAQVYGEDGSLLASLVVEPWPGRHLATASPWSREDVAQPLTYTHPSVVAPPCYDTLPTRVSVDETPNPGGVVAFNDVYAGKTFARAASFRIVGCGNLTLEVTSGPTGPYSVITPGGAVTVSHSPTLYQEARLWLGFTGDRPEAAAPEGSVTITCRETGQVFVFRLLANTVAVPATGVVLAIDRLARVNPVPYRPQTDVTWTWTWRAAGGSR
jgi:hypothetical protein